MATPKHERRKQRPRGLIKKAPPKGQRNGMANGKLHVCDHAMVRYLERVKGIDLEALKREMVDADMRDMIKTLGGNGEFPSATGNYSVVVKENVVITIYI